VWAGRTDQLTDWRDRLHPRLASGLFERGRTILGEPGLGKSALVRRIASEAERKGDWVTPQVRVPSGVDPLELVADALLKLAHVAGLAARREKRLEDLLGRVESVAASGVSPGLREGGGPDAHVMLGDAITRPTTVDAPGGVPVQRSLPIAVYLTGLPEFEDRAGAHRGATFARRFAATVLTAINDDDLALALQEFVTPGRPTADDQGGLEAVSMTQDAVATLIDLCCGGTVPVPARRAAGLVRGHGQHHHR